MALNLAEAKNRCALQMSFCALQHYIQCCAFSATCPECVSILLFKFII